jgi:hypothetical protein
MAAIARKSRLRIRVIGPLLGVVGFLTANSFIPGLLGFVVGFVVFLVCTAICDWIWRRSAGHEEITQDLEDRVRNNIP